MIKSAVRISFLLVAVGIMLTCSRTTVTTSNRASSSDSPLQLTAPKVTVVTQPNPASDIDFATPETGHVLLQVENATGYTVRTLIDETLEAGAHSVLWDGRSDSGEELGSGIYFYHLQADGPSGILEQRLATAICRTDEECKGLVDGL